MQEAIAYFCDALAALEELPDTREHRARRAPLPLDQTGEFHFLHRHREYYDLLIRSEALIRGSNDDFLLGAYLARLGHREWALLDDFQRAAATLEEAAEICERVSNVVDAGAAYAILAWTYQQIGDYPLAESTAIARLTNSAAAFTPSGSAIFVLTAAKPGSCANDGDLDSPPGTRSPTFTLGATHGRCNGTPIPMRAARCHGSHVPASRNIHAGAGPCVGARRFQRWSRTFSRRRRRAIAGRTGCSAQIVAMRCRSICGARRAPGGVYGPPHYRPALITSAAIATATVRTERDGSAHGRPCDLCPRGVWHPLAGAAGRAAAARMGRALVEHARAAADREPCREWWALRIQLTPLQCSTKSPARPLPWQRRKHAGRQAFRAGACPIVGSYGANEAHVAVLPTSSTGDHKGIAHDSPPSVLEDYGSHRSPTIRSRLEAHPRFAHALPH
jgi:hypothetical protein